MQYEELVHFINKRMTMSHIYQPVMLMTLLSSKGKCSAGKIAESVLQHDQSQIDYYTHITNNMVGRVLRRHGIVEKDGGSYRLKDYENLEQNQIDELILLCEKRLDEYIKRRGKAIWQHRKMSAGYIPGSLRYEVLKRAGFHCDLCGVSSDVKALEVDHIIPRNAGGTDDPSNLQALCYSCNAMKRDKDTTDFRKMRDSYAHREIGCPFCGIPENRILTENKLAFAVKDAFPVTPLHCLVIPKRHAAGFFDLYRSELNACDLLLKELKEMIKKDDASVTGFNIGMNSGESAGQTIFHCHIHLIPRRAGDVENPRGGVRHTIPGKGFY